MKTLTCLLIGTLTFVQTQMFAAGVAVAHSTDSQVIIQWAAKENPLLISETTNWQDVIQDADWRVEGNVLVPYKVLLVACPVGTTPQVSVSAEQWETTASQLPSAEVFAFSVELTDSDVKLVSVERWRGFQIAQVEVRGAKPVGLNTTWLKSARVTIDFIGQPRPDAGFVREERLLPLLTLNGKQALRWWELERPSRSALDDAADSWPEFQLHKLGITETGFYAISADWLQVQGVPAVGVPSSQIKMFGNGGRLLPAGLLSTPDTVLKENAILVEDGGDGQFDQGDRIVFFAEGLKGFDYCDGSLLNDQAHASPYATENIYWIGIDPTGTPGLRMETIANLPSATPVTAVQSKTYVDQEQFIYAANTILQANSGVIWYMGTIDPTTTRNIAVNLETVTTGRGTIRIRMDSISGGGSNFNVIVNGTTVSQGAYATPLVINVPEGTLRTGVNTIELVNNTTRQLLLNYVEIIYDRTLSTSTGTLDFAAPIAQTGAFSYQTNLAPSAYIADVTNPLLPRIARGSQFSDSSYALTVRRYFGSNSDGGRIRTPAYRGRKNFDAADYSRLRDTQNEAGIIIITYDDWYDELEPLIEMHARYEEEPLTAVRVKLSHVYDEFSWGVKDPTAIRNFLRYAYENWRGQSGIVEPPRYALFVGDGDYDYRNIVSSSDDNWMPPWEEIGICSDDYYVDFDDVGSNLLDMISGRWPAQNSNEVAAIVDKTVNYALTPLYGPWKNTATFVADDEWKGGFCSEDEHTRDSENLINNVLPEYFTFRKLYEILYPFRQSTSTSAKPDATRDLIETINNGTLLINYVGHGNERVWTDEQMFVMDRDFPMIDNPRVWPVIVAGTCTWGGYDRPNERCFPELLLGAEEIGAIACIAATRYTFVSQNVRLTTEFYREIFRQGIDQRVGLGEALLQVKTISQDNSLYHVLGNPVLRLATPEYYAYVEERDDSLQAGGLFHLRGFVSRTNTESEVRNGPNRNVDEEVWADFQGIVEARVFDSEDSAAYYFPQIGNCSVPQQVPYYYGLPGNAIFRGRSSIVNGRFEVTFRVPRDIQYGGENAKVSLYFFGKSDSESDSADGIGIEQPLRIANAAAALTDSVPPNISVWLENTSFRTGDQVSRTPLLIVRLSDESGLNLSGEVGHKITARIDDAQAEDVTQFFNYDMNSHTAGELQRTIGPMSEGNHRLTIEAWDSFNNLNVYALDFIVGQSAEEGYAIRDVLNWPNPMSSETYFTYSLTQDGTSEVSLRVFTMNGKLVAEMDGLGTRQLFNSNSNHPWNGRDREGHELANGVYFYKLTARHQRGYSAEATGKLVILR